MANDLNSILIEGYLADNPVFENKEPITFASLRIMSTRYIEKPSMAEKPEPHVTGYIVHVSGKLAEHCAKELKRKDKIRVVGYLDVMDLWDSPVDTVIVAEHVERKPK